MVINHLLTGMILQVVKWPGEFVKWLKWRICFNRPLENLGGGNSNIFKFSPRSLGKWSILMSIFFKLGGSTTRARKIRTTATDFLISWFGFFWGLQVWVCLHETTKHIPSLNCLEFVGQVLSEHLGFPHFSTQNFYPDLSHSWSRQPKSCESMLPPFPQWTPWRNNA